MTTEEFIVERKRLLEQINRIELQHEAEEAALTLRHFEELNKLENDLARLTTANLKETK